MVEPPAMAKQDKHTFLVNHTTKQYFIITIIIIIIIIIKAGIYVGPILEPIPFLLYINDLSDEVSSNPVIYADDSAM